MALRGVYYLTGSDDDPVYSSYSTLFCKSVISVILIRNHRSWKNIYYTHTCVFNSFPHLFIYLLFTLLGNLYKTMVLRVFNSFLELSWRIQFLNLYWCKMTMYKIVHFTQSWYAILSQSWSDAWNNGKEVPIWGVAEIQKMSPSTTGRCYFCH